MNSGMNTEPSRCINAMFTTLYLVVMITGIAVGVLLVRPFVQIKVSSDAIETLGTWQMRLNSDGKLVTGATFDIPISFYNPAIFPLTFSPRNVTFYHYPIGSHLECLKWNYTDDHSEDEEPDTKVSTLHMPVLLETTDGLISLKDLTISVPPMSGRFNTFKVKVPVKAYFTIDGKESGTLSELKPMYLDCRKHSRLLLSIRIMDIYTRYWFIIRQVPSAYEILIPLECRVENGVDGIFAKLGSKFTGTILGSSSNLVDKDVNQVVVTP